MAFRCLAFLLVCAMTVFTHADDVVPVKAEWREAHRLSEFYQQGLDVDGVLILASEKVDPRAMQEAAKLIRQMLDDAPGVQKALVKGKVRVTVMAADEYTTDVPEHAFLKPKDHWDRRARGLGATPRVPVVSCGEENLLGMKNDPYRGENILLHEFSHAVHEVGMLGVDATFDGRLKAAYEAAKVKGLWKGTYAETNHKEYFAEASQSWFHCNAAAGGIHNDVTTRKKLREYDPELAKLLVEVYGKNKWVYQGTPKVESEKVFRWRK